MNNRTIALTALFLIMTVNTFGYFSKFLTIDTNSTEYRMLQNPGSFTLEEAALLAAGVGDEFIPGYLTIISNFCEEISPQVTGTDEEKARIIFMEMHKKLLKKYSEFSTTLDLALKNGQFNCLSSTVLYSILLNRFGIPWKALLTPTHVFTSLQFGTNIIDVENTSPYGFNIGQNAEAQETFNRLTGFRYTRDMSRIEIIGKEGLIGYTYNNIAYGSDRLGQKQQAFENALRAWAVYPSGGFIYSNIHAAYSSYSHELNRLRDYQKSMKILLEARQNLKDTDRYFTNYFFALDMQLAELIKAGATGEAMSIFDESSKVIKAPVKIEENLYGAILYRLIRVEKNYQAAYTFGKKILAEKPSSLNSLIGIAEGMNSLARQMAGAFATYPAGVDELIAWKPLVTSKVFTTVMENYYSEVSFRFYQNRETARALGAAQDGLKLLPGSEVLEINYLMIANNTAAELMKKNDFEGALPYLKQALTVKPGNPTAVTNITGVYRSLVTRELDKENWKKAHSLSTEGLGFAPEDPKLLYYQKYCEKKIK